MTHKPIYSAKRVHKRMGEMFTVIVERGEDGYLVSEVLELAGCHSQAKTYDELMERTREAIALCLATNPVRKNTFVGLQQLEV